jgi:hypothetical protein
MAQLMNRRAALAAFAALAAGSVLGVGYVIRNIFESASPRFRLTNGPGDGSVVPRMGDACVSPWITGLFRCARGSGRSPIR